jgi:hypothetical protein
MHRSNLLALGLVIHKTPSAMKHILPVLTVTALAAAASAQVAPAPAAKQSLSYNRVVASWVSQSDTDYNGASVFAQAKLGSGFYVAASVTDLETRDFDDNTAVLGYAYSLPSIFGVATDLNVELGYSSLGAGLRFLIGGGVELNAAYAHGAGSDRADTFTVGASYNLGFLAKGLSLNASYASQTNPDGVTFLGSLVNPGHDTTSIGIGYNF